ncbi:MAG TPA: sigma-54 dependent transcriptional regulator, partial [Myxococcota bacterium]|nr:sigma-54 dependent transcriptional regulator [Myxococcota bacterium]
MSAASRRPREAGGRAVGRPGPRRQRILVVDDAEGIRGYVASLLELRGYQVDTCENGRRALELLDAGAAPQVILLDVMMPGMDGLETLRQIREKHPDPDVVILSVVGRAQTIVEAMQLGAADYLNKPFDEAELEATLRALLERRGLREERTRLQGELGVADTAVWRSDAMQRIRDAIEQIADTDVTVLIQGESGSGKEIVAREIHSRSTRRTKPFVKVNCAALPGELLESELFGYEKGAFTGAVGRKPGKFELAEGGTVFLDEIGEMSAGLQAKLLQVMQDAVFTRLGGHDEIRADVRVVCATHRELERMVREGAFREDLWFRLNVVSLHVPPLRERRDEIAPLIDGFLARYSARYRRPRPQLSARLIRILERHPFPGNVRELENMVKRIIVLGSERVVLDALLAPSDDAAERRAASLERVIAELEATAG